LEPGQTDSPKGRRAIGLIWQAEATKDGSRVHVGVDLRGNVV
jgi:hypothetical protein